MPAESYAAAATVCRSSGSTPAITAWACLTSDNSGSVNTPRDRSLWPMTAPQKTVLVTGASAGFGAAFVRRFAAEGARVVASARRMDRLTELADEVDGDVLPLELDVRDQEAVQAAISGLPAEYAEVDVLVNNAGLALGMDPA